MILWINWRPLSRLVLPIKKRVHWQKYRLKLFINYQNRNPEYVQRKEVLKEYTSLRARITVSNAVSKDIDTAKWYLERKKKGEFTPNPELGLQTNILVLNDDKQSQITESVRNWAETE